MAARNWTVRLNDHDDDRLDRLAEARGVSRATVVRALIRDADLEAGGGLPAVADRDELLRLLSEKARSGHHGAMVTLAHLIDAEPDEDEDEDPFAALDALAARRESRPPRSAA